MKRFFSLMLAVTMLFSLCTTAFANNNEGDFYADETFDSASEEEMPYEGEAEGAAEAEPDDEEVPFYEESSVVVTEPYEDDTPEEEPVSEGELNLTDEQPVEEQESAQDEPLSAPEAAKADEQPVEEEDCYQEEPDYVDDAEELSAKMTLSEAIFAFLMGTGENIYQVTEPETIWESLTIPARFELSVCENGTLTIGPDAVLSVEGTLTVVDQGAACIRNEGTLLLQENAVCSVPVNRFFGNMPVTPQVIYEETPDYSEPVHTIPEASEEEEESDFEYSLTLEESVQEKTAPSTSEEEVTDYSDGLENADDIVPIEEKQKDDEQEEVYDSESTEEGSEGEEKSFLGGFVNFLLGKSSSSRGYDTTPPVVTDVILSASTVTAPGSVQVTIIATDDSSGLSRGMVRFENHETDGYIKAESSTLDENGNLTMTIDISEYTNAGAYKISVVDLKDASYNGRTYYGEGSQFFSTATYKLPEGCRARTITVINDKPVDTTPPVVTDVILSTNTVTLPGTVQVTVVASDDISGVEDAWVFFDNQDIDDLSVGTAPDSNGTISGSLWVSENETPGEYIISQINIKDNAGNIRSYVGTGNTWSYENYPDHRLPDNCCSVKFTVKNPDPPDKTPPVLTDVTLNSSTVSVPGTIQATLTATDESSGIQYADIIFINPDTGKTVYGSINAETDGSIPNGLIPITIPIPEGTYSGDYVVLSVFVQDNAYNYRYYYGTGKPSYYNYYTDQRLPDHCCSATFTVTNGVYMDTTPPYVIDLIVSPSTVTKPAIVQAKADTAYDPSGIKNASIQFKNSKTGNSLGTYGIQNGDGTITFTIEVLGHTNPGDYTVSFVYVQDNADNAAYYYGTGNMADYNNYPDQRLPDHCCSATLTVTEEGALAITTHPSSVTAVAGNTATFTVNASVPSGKTASYQWQYKTSSGSWTNSTGTGNKTATLCFTAKTSFNGRQYRCKVTDGTTTVYSDPATLTVTEQEALAITTHPSSVTAAAGNTVTFAVNASVPSGKTASYQWQYKTGSGSWTNSTGTGNKTEMLSFTAKTSFNGRQYRCMVTDGTTTVYSNPATLTVTGPAFSITTHPTSITVASGNAASFTVEVSVPSGNTVSYQWQYKTSSGSWTNSTGAGNKTEVLSFKAKTSFNGRQYRCKVTDGTTTVYSNPATLTVTEQEALAITTHPSSVTIVAGNTATFAVNASVPSGKTASYQWQYKTSSGSWTNSTGTGNKTATLSFTAKTSFNGRQYRCKVTDGTTTVYSNAATLTVESTTPASDS